MAVSFACPQGHQWSAEVSSSAMVPVCPQCGQRGQAVSVNGTMLSGAATAMPEPSGSGPVTQAIPSPADVRPAAPGPLPAVPGYELLDLLGRGGMGVVYKARQMGLNRLVALKMVLAGEHAGPAELNRFKTEAEAVAKLQHPNIVQVFDIGEQEGRPFFAMEFVAGGSLMRRLRGEPQPPREAAQLVETLARAMHDAHLAGIVHRDLKPANVLLAGGAKAWRKEGGSAESANGSASLASSAASPLHFLVPKIADFGLAKDMQTDNGQTASGTIIGTPSYMAPEQAEGRVKDIGPAADVYALGAILYEMLVGRPPFKAATPVDTIMQVLRDEPLSPARLQPKTPRDLDTICLKCLEKLPARRYASARELADDLERFRKGETVFARPVGKLEWGWRWCRRNPVVAGSLAAVALAMILGTLVSVAFAMQAHRERALAQGAEGNAERSAAVARQERNAAQTAKEAAEARADEAYHHRYLAHMSVADAYWSQGNFAPIRELMDSYRQTAAGRRNPCGWEWHFQERLLETSLRILTGHSKNVHSVAFSPDGATLASASEEHSIGLWDLASGELRNTFTGHTGAVNRVCFSPDGGQLASASNDGTVRLWDVAGRQPLGVLQGHTGMVYYVTFSPDGQRLATCSADRTVQTWEVSSGRSFRTFVGHNERVLTVTFSPDGTRLASCGHDNKVRLWDAATGQLQRVLDGQTLVVYSVAFSPDGRRLVSTAGDQTIRIWDARSGELLKALAPHAGGVRAAAFSPDGSRLATAHGDQTVRLWDAATGQQLCVHHGHTAQVFSVAFSPDGLRLASGAADHTVRLWSATGGEPVRVLHGHPGAISSVAFRPQRPTANDQQKPLSTLFASGGSDSTIRLWDPASGQTVRTLEGHTRPVWGVAFSPDGRLLASGSYDNDVRLWDVASGEALRTFRGHTRGVTGVAFSPDGTLLASSSNDRTARIWEVSSGRLLHALEGHTDNVWSVAFSPDGTRLASSSWDTTARLWDVASGQPLRTFTGHTIGATKVLFTPSGTQIATASADRTVRLWDVATGQQIRSFTGHVDPLWGLALNPDGTRLASASWDKTIRVWDVATGQPLRTLSGHKEKVWCVAFSPDGMQLVSGSGDQTVRLWDARPLSANLRVEREAHALLDAHRAAGLLQEQIGARVRERSGISAEVRDLAQRWLSHESDEPDQINARAWFIARDPDCPSVQYQSALLQAKAALALAPENGGVLNTLGVAEYRCGRYAEALETLRRASYFNVGRWRGAIALDVGKLLMSPWLLPATKFSLYAEPADVAFLAMTHHRLGEAGAAREMLTLLRTMAKQPFWSEDEQVQGHLREAEKLIAGNAGGYLP